MKSPQKLRRSARGLRNFAFWVKGRVFAVQFNLLSSYRQTVLGVPTISEGLAVVQEGGYVRLLFAARDDTRLGSVQLAAGQPPPASPGDPVIGQGAGEDIAVQSTAQGQRAYVFSAFDGILRQAVLQSDGAPGSTKVTLGTAGALFGVTAMEIIEGAGGDLAVVARKDQPGVQIFRLSDLGELTPLSVLRDGAKAYLGDVADLAAFRTGGQDFLMVASPRESGLTLYSLNADGEAVFTDAFGAKSGLPIAGPSALQTVGLEGVAFVVVASAISDSLTVVRVNAAGVMFLADHLIDDRSTRFAGVSALDMFSWAGRSFVVAAGSDSGVTLVEVLPGGKLSVLTSLAMETGEGLANVTGIEAAVVGSVASIFLTDARGDRIHRLTLDLGETGGSVRPVSGQATGGNLDERLLGGGAAETLQGGGGDDFLHDGAGSDVLTGGAGADVFVLSRDGSADQITDFQQGIDKIDVSDWGRFYSASSLSLDRVSTGAVVTYWNETLTVTRSERGALTLTDADFLF